jgi:hypothetical protein
MREQRVYHYVDLDDSDHWCENGCRSPKGMKVYIDEYKGFNPAFWCEECVKGNVNFTFKIIGWLDREEYLEKQRDFYEKTEER